MQYATHPHPSPPLEGMCANFSAPIHLALPFKGRVGVGMGKNSSASDPIPLLSSPLKGEELGKLALMPLEGEFLRMG